MGEYLKGVIKMVWRHPEDQELPKPKRKTNRDALMSMDLCDCLYHMQCRIDEYARDVCCIMDALGVDYSKRCGKYGRACKACIAAWLNEESETG